MRNLYSFFILLVGAYFCNAQYHFEGQLANDTPNRTVYLSVIEDYRKVSRVSLEQIFRKTEADSLGFFQFDGENLPKRNRIYRIHIDNCAELGVDPDHVFGGCTDTKSIVFIAHNKDTIRFEKTFADEVFCNISSTNPKSGALLEVEMLKEEMVFDFSDFRSAANRKLNTEKWFEKLQRYGKDANEPLVDLYIYDFLSDRRNETYSYYLNDIARNEYYTDLESRLKENYPNSSYTRLYAREIANDKNMVTQEAGTAVYWKWFFAMLLGLSVLLNLFLFKKVLGKNNKHRFEKLTAQERKIVAGILNDKTNKEIATALFISHSTVKTHINNLYKKLNVSGRDEIKARF